MNTSEMLSILLETVFAPTGKVILPFQVNLILRNGSRFSVRTCEQFLHSEILLITYWEEQNLSPKKIEEIKQSVAKRHDSSYFFKPDSEDEELRYGQIIVSRDRLAYLQFHSTAEIPDVPPETIGFITE